MNAIVQGLLRGGERNSGFCVATCFCIGPSGAHVNACVSVVAGGSVVVSTIEFLFTGNHILPGGRVLASLCVAIGSSA